MTQIIKTDYVHPEVLVDTQWLEEHLSDPSIKIAEVDYDSQSNYDIGHIPNSYLLDWKKDINHDVTRDVLTIDKYQELLGRIGINDDNTTLILYGDFNNWFAAFAFWVFKYYGYKDVKLLNGGRKKWLEEDKPITREVPSYSRANFKASDPDNTIRVFMNNVKEALKKKDKGLVDVRSPKEFTGEVLAPPEYPTEHAQRGGHIPGAVNIPWSQAVKDDGTFKSVEELTNLYDPKGIVPDKEIITYCRIGERSSH